MMNPNRERFLFVCAISLLLTLPAPLPAQEWTRFRGPNGTGISHATTVPVALSESDYTWRVQLPGEGHSSPVVWGNRIFLTSAEESSGQWHLLCLSTGDGRQLWVRTCHFKPYRKHRLNSFASTTPAVDADHVYVTLTTPKSLTALAFDHNGEEVWRRDLGMYEAMHGAAASPIVVGDVVIIANDQGDHDPTVSSDGAKPESFLIGLDCKTGAVRWKHQRTTGATAPYSTPLVYEPQDGPLEVIFTSTAHGVTSLNPQTGELNWEAPGVFKARCVGSPVLANGLVFATAGNGAGDRQNAAVRPGSRKKNIPPQVEYQIRRGIPYVPTPIAVGDLLFLWGDGGIVTCVWAATGEQIWMERVGGTFYGSPVCVNGKLYALSSRGELVVIEASDRFKLLARSNLGEPSHATPAVADGVMYLRTMNHLISVGGQKSSGQ